MSQSVMNYILSKPGCPSEYLIGTVKYFKHIKTDHDTLNNEIIQALGIDVSGMAMPAIQKHTLLQYIVQVGWKSYNTNQGLLEDEVLHKALEDLNKLYSHKFVRMALLEESADRRNTLSKGELAYDVYCDNVAKLSRDEMVELLQTELRTSQSGATTYYYNAKSRYGATK